MMMLESIYIYMWVYYPIPETITHMTHLFRAFVTFLLCFIIITIEAIFVFLENKSWKACTERAFSH